MHNKNKMESHNHLK